MPPQGVSSLIDAILPLLSLLYRLKIAKPSMLDELFRDHAGGVFHAGGERLILRTEQAAAADDFAHFRCDGRLRSERVACDAREGVQGNRWLIGIENRVGADSGLPTYRECRRVVHSGL